jgi:hypothetical protein
VLPPVGGAPHVQDRTEDRGAAGVDEATTFMSQWGPPPLARPTEDRRAAPPDRGWSPPAPPSRTGAGRSADSPADPPAPHPTRQPAADDPAGNAWSDPRPQDSGALPPVADARTVAGTGSAAEQWIAERLAADRDRLAASRTGVDRRPPADPDGRPSGGRRSDDAFAGWAAEAPTDRPKTRPAGPDWLAADRTAERGERAGGPDRLAAGRPAEAPVERTGPGSTGPGWLAAGQAAGRTAEAVGRGGRVEDATEVIGPFDVGAWSVQDRDGTVAPARPRGR